MQYGIPEYYLVHKYLKKLNKSMAFESVWCEIQAKNFFCDPLLICVAMCNPDPYAYAIFLRKYFFFSVLRISIVSVFRSIVSVFRSQGRIDRITFLRKFKFLHCFISFFFPFSILYQIWNNSFHFGWE